MKKEKTVVFRIDDDLYTFLQNVASNNRSSVSYEIRKLILEKYKKKQDLENWIG
jgi:predicted CopG family antitoxin